MSQNFKTSQKSPLRNRIERERTDTIDPFVLDHVNAFLQNFASLPRMDKIDLTTVDGAKDAVGMLNARQDDLATKLRTVRALQTLLNQEKK